MARKQWVNSFSVNFIGLQMRQNGIAVISFSQNCAQSSKVFGPKASRGPT
jgi:hypothetical protein